MSKLNILIVEDELIIAESLKLILEDMGYQIPAIFMSGEALLDQFKPGLADIIFMDIHLAGKTNGIDTAIELKKISTAPVIYITDNQNDSLRKRAIHETNTVQYITKPFSSLDITVALELALKAIKGNRPFPNMSTPSTYFNNDSIFVKKNQGFIKIMIDDILFLKAEGSYCKLVYKGTPNASGKHVEEQILYSENLSFLEERLSFALRLVRVHRSYIINSGAIKRIFENRLWIEENEIPIGKTYKNEVLGRFHFL